MLPFHNLQDTHVQLKPRTTLHEIAIYCRIVWTIPASVGSGQNYKRNGNMLPFHNLQATHNLNHAQIYMKLRYRIVWTIPASVGSGQNYKRNGYWFTDEGPFHSKKLKFCLRF
jgi:hypothetical protein